MAGTSLTRIILPALAAVTAVPLSLLLALQILQPAWLITSWPWLGAFALSGVGMILFGRYVQRRAVRTGQLLLAASQGESKPFDTESVGPVQQVLTTILDRHHRNESDLRASEQRFQLALEASDALLWEYCPGSGKFSFDTTAGRRILGVEADGIGDCTLPLEQYTEMIHPDDSARLQRVRDELYRSGIFNCEYRVRHPLRGYIWVRCRGRVVERAEDGTALRALGTVCDITDLKQIEERLQAALIAAEDAGHTRAQFLSGISHELRTPLNGVLGYTQLLLRDTELVGEQHNHLQAIERCGQHLLRLINDIIDLAQIDSGHTELHEAECDLHALLESVGEVASRQAETKGLRFTLERDPALPALLMTDELKLRQILSNLLSNAIKFTASGCVALRVRRAGDSGAMLRFEVSDTGAGIAAERLAELFEPHSHVGCSRIDAAGTDGGLGLAVSQRLCRLMGGYIEVDSAVGSGSCFHFTLPCRSCAERPAAAESSRMADAVSGAPLRQLPASELAPLQEALALGDPEGLRAALSELRRRIPSAQPLLDKCQRLVDGFELDQIRELLEDQPERG